MLQHQTGCEQERHRISEALPGDVGSGAVHGFEDGRVVPDIGARSEAQPADQSGHLIGEDVPE
jgi:hypothetical protein